MLSIHTIPALCSNYFWLLQPTPDSCHAYILDPGDATPVLSCLGQHQLNLAAIIITHHHHDHVDGILPLLERFPSIPVYGTRNPAIPGVTHELKGGEQLVLPDLALEVLSLPGHTPDHLGYLYRPASGPWRLFCGDALFSAGCGRLLGGTAEDLYHSLQQLARLPDDTLVYCSHEYTLANLAFALAVEPNNREAAHHLGKVKELIARRLPSIPTFIGHEKQINPFLRCHLPEVRTSVEAFSSQKLDSPNAVFTELRRWKDQF